MLQKLIGTLVHAGFLSKDQRPLVLLTYHPSTVCPYFFASDGLGGKVIGAIIETTLDQAAVETQKVLHLCLDTLGPVRSIIHLAPEINTYLLMFDHGSDLCLFGLVEAREIHCEVLKTGK